MGNKVFELFGSIKINTKEVAKKLKEVRDGAAKTANSIGDKFSKLGNDLANSIGGISKGISGAATSVGTTAVNIGNKLTNSITKPATAAATAISAIGFTKGINRFVGIDTAKAKLTALKFTAQEVEGVMDSALKSVSGTAFGLEEAATTAASAVAAGIEQGKDLDNYLTTIADTAAVTGDSMADMGSIFNKVATAGKAGREELQMLADRGLPIFQYLQETLGVTNEELQDMVTKGEISLQDFRRALEENVGGAAKTMGAESLTAAIDNIGASLGRMFLNLLQGSKDGEGVLDRLKVIIVDLLEVMRDAEKHFKEAGDVIAKKFNEVVPTVSELKEKIANLSDEGKNMVKWLPVLAIAIGPFLKAMGKVLQMAGKGSSAFNKLGKSILNAGKDMKGFGKGLTQALSMLSSFGGLGIIMTAIGAIVTAFGLIPQAAMDVLNNTLTVAKDKLNSLADTVREFASNKLPAIMKRGGDNLASILQNLTGMMPAISEMGTSILTGLIDGMTQSDGVLTFVVEFITSIGQAIADNIGLIFQLGTLLITQLATAISNNSEDIVALAITIIEQLTLGFLEAIPQLAEAAIAIITGLVNGIVENREMVLEGVQEILLAIGEALSNPAVWQMIGVIAMGLLGQSLITEGIKVFLGAAAKWVGTLLASIMGWQVALIALAVLIVGWLCDWDWNKFKDAAKKAVDWIVNGVKSLWGKIKEAGKNVADKAVEGIKSLGEGFIQAGKWVVDGFINGIKSGVGAVWEAAKSLAQSAWNSIKSFFNFGSPSKLTYQGGEWVTQGMINGMVSLKRPLQKAASQVADWASPQLEAINVDYNDSKFNLPDLSGVASYTVDTSVTGLNTYNSSQQRMLDEANSLLGETNMILRQIYSKDNNIYMNRRLVSEELDEPLHEFRENRQRLENRVQGVW